MFYNDFMALKKAALKIRQPNMGAWDTVEKQAKTINRLKAKIKQLEDELFEVVVLGKPKPKKKAK